MGPLRKDHFLFLSLKNARRKSACLEILIGLLAFVVDKL